ncbi:MAG: MFS transporter [Chitinispirillia bacterium]
MNNRIVHSNLKNSSNKNHIADRTIRIFGITSFGHALCHIYIIAFSAILGLMAQEFNLSLTQITGIGSICFILFGIGSFPAGIITSYSNPKLTLSLFYAGSALASIIIYFSSNVNMLIVGIAMLGLFASIYHVAGLSLIAYHIKKIGKSYGVHGVAGSAGIALAPLIASVIANNFGWRAVYLILAIPGIFGFLFLVFDRTIPANRSIELPKRSESRKKIILFFILFLLIMMINGFVYRAWLTIFPTYISERIHLNNLNPLLTGGFLSSAILAFGMIGQYVAGVLSDYVNRLLLYFLLLAVAGINLILIGLNTNILLLFIAIIFSLFYFALQPIENSIISLVSPSKFTSSVFGLKFILTFGVGGLGGVFSGYISENMGTHFVFIFVGAASGVCAVMALFLIGKVKTS